MAERQATWLKDGVATGAVEERLAMASLIARPGIDGVGDLLVSAPGTTNVSAGIGGAWIARTAAFQGHEHVVNDSAKLIGIGATAAGVSRRDLIVARITALGWVLEAVPGVAAASPADPVQPADSLLLARVVVPASTSVITGAMLTDLRVQHNLGNGAVLSVANAAARIALAAYAGLIVNQTDSGDTFQFQSGIWKRIAVGGAAQTNTFLAFSIAIPAAAPDGNGDRNQNIGFTINDGDIIICYYIDGFSNRWVLVPSFWFNQTIAHRTTQVHSVQGIGTGTTLNYRIFRTM